MIDIAFGYFMEAARFTFSLIGLAIRGVLFLVSLGLNKRQENPPPSKSSPDLFDPPAK
jgi:hypothetical protein